MKKSVSVLLMLAITFCLNAQVIPVDLIEFKPEVVCPGDSVEAHFVFTAPVQPTQVVNVQVSLDKTPIIINNILFSGPISSLMIVDTIQQGVVYAKKFQVPIYTPHGLWSANANIPNPRPINLIVNQCADTQNQLDIQGVENDTLCTGDSLTVYYKIIPGQYIQLTLFQPSVIGNIWQWPDSVWYNQPYTVVGNDTIYKIKVFPNGFQPGPAILYSPWGGNSFPIFFVLCTAIREQELDLSKAIYLDFNNQQVHYLQPNTLYIREIQHNGKAYRKLIMVRE